MRVFFQKVWIFAIILFVVSSCAATLVTGGNNSGGNTLSSGIFVTTNGNDTGDGLTPSTPVKSIQVAVQKAVSNNLTNIYIQSGVYTPGNGLNASDYGLIIDSGTNNLCFLGGCDASFSTTRNGYSELDGLFMLSNVVRSQNVNNLVFDRLVVRGGMMRGETAPNNRGGGFYFYYVSDILITNCVISNNVAFNSGGGLCVYLGARCLISADIVGNFCTNSVGTQNFGGGISLENSYLCRITGSISNNLLGSFDYFCYGGGLYLGWGQSNYVNAVICSNRAISLSASGGGIFINHDYYALITGEISRNYAFSNNCFGAGIFVSVGIGTVISNATLVGNYCRTRGGAIYIEDCTNTKIINCLMTNNQNDFYGVLDISLTDPRFCGLLVSNCILGAASNCHGITEMTGGGAYDVTNHILVDNRFLTNRLGQLYYDFYSNYINIDLISRVNSNVYTGAALTYGNVATND